MLPFLKYSVMRLALFVALLAVFWVLGAGRIVAIIGAALASMMLSYIFLRGPRQAVTAEIADHVQRRTERRAPTATELDEAAEDAAAERAAAEHAPAEHAPTEHAPAEHARAERAGGSERQADA